MLRSVASAAWTRCQGKESCLCEANPVSKMPSSADKVDIDMGPKARLLHCGTMSLHTPEEAGTVAGLTFGNEVKRALVGIRP